MPTIEFIAEIKGLKDQIKKLKSTAEYKKKYISKLEKENISLHKKVDNKYWFQDGN